MQAVILAAGLGTRLRPVTNGRSKAMVPIVGKPLVELALEPVVDNGVRELVIVIGSDDKEIREHFRNRTELDVSIRWVTQDERLGMGHALQLATPFVRGPFILSACDSLVSASHIRDLLRSASDADTVLSLLEVEPQLVTRSAAVELEGEVVRRIVEKPTLEDAPSHTVSLPHYVVSPHLLPLLSEVSRSRRGEFELQDAIQRHIDSGARVVGVRTNQRLQVSTPEDLLALNRRVLREGDRSRRAGPSPIGTATLVVEPVFVEPGAEVGRGCTIGPETYLESGCVIGDGAEVRRSVVLRGARVGDGDRVLDSVVVG